MGDLLGPIGRRDEARAQFDTVLAWARSRRRTRSAKRAMQRKLAGLHWDAGERERSFACLREGLRLLGGDSRSRRDRRRHRHRAGPPVPGDGPPLVSHRRQPGGGRVDRARVAAGRARGRPRPGRRGPKSHRRRGDLARAQHARRGVGKARSPGRGRAPHGAQRRRRGGGGPPAGRLPQLRQSRRAVRDARPGPRRADLPPGPRDRAEDRRPRLPVTPVRQPRGGVLRAHAALRRRRPARGAIGDRPRSPARPDRPPRGAADRPRPDPPVPRRVREGARLLRGSARRWPRRWASRS